MSSSNSVNELSYHPIPEARLRERFLLVFRLGFLGVDLFVLLFPVGTYHPGAPSTATARIHDTCDK